MEISVVWNTKLIVLLKNSDVVVSFKYSSLKSVVLIGIYNSLRELKKIFYYLR